jgi:hypothetical protein
MALATAASGRQPASPLDFDSAENLYAIATAAAGSNDVMTLHNGRHAALSCFMAPPRAQAEALVAGGRGDAIQEERKRAAGVLLRKCAGFYDNDEAANFALRRRLQSGLQAHAGEYRSGTTQGGATDKQIVLAIERGDWVTFGSAYSDIWPRALARAGIAPESETALLFRVAALAALCDIGQDCSPNGLSYVIRCTTTPRSAPARGRRSTSARFRRRSR